MISRVLLTWATFWAGVVGAIIALAVASWHVALIVFAIFLLLTIIQVVLVVLRGFKKIQKEFDDFDKPGWNARRR